MIGVIDYGMGNLLSVSKALERLSVDYIVSDKEEELQKTDGLILPGVGSFHDAVRLLRETNLFSFIQKEVAKETPLLGICLGMQLLFEASEENGQTNGLGFLPGQAVRFPGIKKSGARYKVPHMGWNQLQVNEPDSPLLEGIAEGYVYFVHSYYIKTSDESVLIATSSYDVDVPAVVGKGSVYGTQFHPEKSGAVGMALLNNFIKNVVEKR